MGNMDALEAFGTPIIPDHYQTPDETQQERLLIWIIETCLTKEERELTYARYYDRLSIRQIVNKFWPERTYGYGQWKLRKLTSRLRQLADQHGLVQNPF